MPPRAITTDSYSRRHSQNLHRTLSSSSSSSTASFKKDNHVHFSENLEEIPARHEKPPKELCWYNRRDYAAFRYDNILTLQTIQEGMELNQEEQCTRGLERLISLPIQKGHRQRIIQTILEEQDAQLLVLGRRNEESLRAVSKSNTATERLHAISVAAQDAFYVATTVWLEDDLDGNQDFNKTIMDNGCASPPSRVVAVFEPFTKDKVNATLANKTRPTTTGRTRRLPQDATATPRSTTYCGSRLFPSSSSSKTKFQHKRKQFFDNMSENAVHNLGRVFCASSVSQKGVC